MPIQFSPKAPKTATKVISDHLGDTPNYFVTEAVRSASAGGATPPQISLSQGWQEYAVGLEDLAKGKLLAAAKPGHWRYLVMLGNQPTAEMVLAQESAGERVIASHRGEVMVGMAKGLKVAADLKETADQPYEVRFLLVPALYFTALWLHGAHGVDWLMPIEPDPSPLPNYKPHTEAQVIEALKGRVKAAQAFGTKAAK
ncbi:MAG: hypothetical protein HQL51_02635 [Magnetococcales bacterium]|nr:hypothetical protein [Magnetococcales bacterium]